MTTVIYGKKMIMGEVYVGNSRRGVTQIALYPMKVTQLKTHEKDGYESAQVGFGTPKKHSRLKVGKNREIKGVENTTLGATINPQDVVSVGSLCLIQGTSKGKGFSGVVKRWNFASGPATHGQSDRLRAPGSIGQGTTPGRVRKGKKMAGHHGTKTVTVRGAMVVAVNADNTIWVTGPVPGARHSLLRLTVVGKKEGISISYLSGGLSKALTTEEVKD